VVSVGLVGYGRWGRAHLRVLQQLQNDGLIHRIAVCDVNPVQLKGLVVDAVYAHIDELLAGETLDAVALVTPPESHLDLLQRVVGEGLAVLVEKPLSDDHQAAAEVLRNLPNQTVMLVGYLLRHHPGVLRLKSAIEDDALAGIEVVAYVRRTTRPQPEGTDALVTLAVHGLDTVAWLLDEALMDMEVVHMDRQSEGVLMRLRDQYGRMAIVDTAWGASEEVRKIAVQTSTLAAALDFGEGELTWHLDQEAAGDSVVERYASQALEEEWRVFLDMVQAKEPTILPSIDSLLDQSEWFAHHG
jgi:predicted dehydrogenase